MVRQDGSAPPASAVSGRRSAIELLARHEMHTAIDNPGWICTTSLPGQNRALCELSYRAVRYWMYLHKVVGHPGDAPGVSPIRTARIAVFLVPEKMKWNEKWSHGERPTRSAHTLAER